MSNGEMIQSAELMPSRTYVESQTRGEVDMQVSTARRFPRSVKTFKERALSLATLDEETAASCFYSLPRGGKAIEGPSARLAEIVAASWGNLRSQACVVDVDKKFVTARGTCWDLENNTAVSVEVQKRITDSKGRPYNDDMIGVTSNAACAIALRNAVFKVVPMAMVKPIYDAARKVAIGDAQTLNARRHKMVDHFGKMGVRLDQILAKVERVSIEDISLDDLAVLIGLSTAIKDGDTSIDEAFAVAEQSKKEAGTKSDQLADKLKKPETKKQEGSPLDWCEAKITELGIEAKKTENQVTAMLQNGIMLRVVNGDPGPVDDATQAVNCNDPDTLIQVQNIIERSRKTR